VLIIHYNALERNLKAHPASAFPRQRFDAALASGLARFGASVVRYGLYETVIPGTSPVLPLHKENKRTQQQSPVWFITVSAMRTTSSIRI
jgi:hypothetical protein